MVPEQPVVAPKMTPARRSTVRHWLYDRPLSMVTALMFGGLAGLSTLVWEWLFVLPMGVYLGVMVWDLVTYKRQESGGA